MKGKISLKSIIVLIILLLVVVLLVLSIKTFRTYISSAAGGIEPKNVVASLNADGNSAIISWTSESDSIGVVEYGTNPSSLLLRAAESSLVTKHEVTLTPLRAGTTYYYQIRIGEGDAFNNKGIPYTFKTKAAEEVAPEMPNETILTPTITMTPLVSEATEGGKICDGNTDYNNDGVINSLDIIICKKGNLDVAPANEINTTEECSDGIDYNNDGIINSLDKLKCLQSQKQ